MKSYIELVDEVATLRGSNGGTEKDFAITRAKYLGNLLEKLASDAGEELPENFVGNAKAAFFRVFATKTFPANASAQRQALERFRRGDEPTDEIELPPEL